MQSKSNQAPDQLEVEIAHLKQRDPTPRLSGTAKARILQAVCQAEVSIFERAWHLLHRRTGLDIRPAVIGGLSCAGFLGIGIGALANVDINQADLTPEQELAYYYELEIQDEDGLTDISVDGEV